MADPRAARWSGEPWGTVADPDGTIHRIWRVADPDVLAAVTAELAESELLIADGHHRYETARTYADEIGGEGAHRFTLMALVSLEDPGLTVFGYHRLLTDLRGGEKPEILANALREHFEIEEVPLGELDPAGEEGVGVFGYVDAHFKHGFPAAAEGHGGHRRGTRRSLRAVPATRRGDSRDLDPPWRSGDDRGGRRGKARHRVHGVRRGRDRSRSTTAPTPPS